MNDNFQLASYLAFGGFLVIAVTVVASIFIDVSAPVSATTAYTVEIIDNCEYLKFQTYQHEAITHKGNCKNH